MKTPRALELCSLLARGLWYACGSRGGDLPSDPKQLARVLCATKREVAAAMPELIAAGVAAISGAHFQLVGAGAEQMVERRREQWRESKRRSRSVHTVHVDNSTMSTADKQDTTSTCPHVDRQQCPPVDMLTKEAVSPRTPLPKKNISPGIYSQAFLQFWGKYPRKTAKLSAAKAFAKCSADNELLAKMLSALEWQTASEQWREEGGKFIPHAATWLNQRRWEDEDWSISDQKNEQKNSAKTAGKFAQKYTRNRPEELYVGAPEPSTPISERERDYRLLYSRAGRQEAARAFPDLAERDRRAEAEMAAQIEAERQQSAFGEAPAIALAASAAK